MLHYFLFILEHCVVTDIHVVNVSLSCLQVVDSFKTCDNLVIIVMQQLHSVHLGFLYTLYDISQTCDCMQSYALLCTHACCLKWRFNYKNVNIMKNLMGFEVPIFHSPSYLSSPSPFFFVLGQCKMEYSM